MDTVNNLASAASRAIWGEGNGANGAQTKDNETSGQEPVSGETGNVEAGEPYDKGNAEPTSTPSEPKITADEPTTSTLTQNPKITDTTSSTTDSIGDSKPSSAAPNAADPSSAQQPTQKQQGADRPSDEPSSLEHERIKETKAEAEDAAKVDTTEAGPKTLDEKARDSGGVVGKGEGKGKSGENEGEEEDGLQKESHGEGTGEKYVKSSGVVADGGDFDAASPGAGREADRLLEQKGITHESAAAGPLAGKGDVGGKDEKASKPKLSEKIKAKLHIGGKDKD
ncbi:hypothetical protein BGZ57DRAFT_1000768 [Hyaloscypha finlandica]|nr:hypothetical protein BGZ57DRAFT_1000768 [Hyaloscypha finlandica]